MPPVIFDAFEVQVPPGWADITDSLEAENPPYTLAHADGAGALQFSIALYQSGPVPDPTPGVLLKMVKEFGRKMALGKPSAIITEAGPPVLAAGTFAWDDDYLRVWQVSDGRNFAFATYTCAAEHAGPELKVCEQIVRSIRFPRERKSPIGTKSI